MVWHGNVHAGHFALTVDTGGACTVLYFEQVADRYKSLGSFHGQVFDIGMALAVFLLHAHIHVVFFAVFGVLPRLVTAYGDIVHGGKGLQGHAVVGQGLPVGNQADFGLTRFVAGLYIHNAGNVFFDTVHNEFRGLDHGVLLETVHFKHHVACAVVVHFGGGGGLDGDIGVRNIGQVGAQGVHNLVGAPGAAFPVLQQLDTHVGLVHGTAVAAGTAYVHAVVYDFWNALYAFFDNLGYAIGCLHVGTHGHFQLDANHALVLLGHQFHGHVGSCHVTYEQDHGHKCQHLENNTGNGQAERKGL